MLEMQLDHRYCPTCESEQLFEAPVCQDGHDVDCPDLSCVTCGTALFVIVISESAAPQAAPLSARTVRRSA